MTFWPDHGTMNICSAPLVGALSRLAQTTTACMPYRISTSEQGTPHAASSSTWIALTFPSTNRWCLSACRVIKPFKSSSCCICSILASPGAPVS